MRILHVVDAYHPSVGGMQEQVRQISERLVQRGHEVTVATRRDPQRTFEVLNGVRVRAFSVGGNFVRGITGETSNFISFCKDGSFDVATVFAAQYGLCDAFLLHLEELRCKKVFAPTGLSAMYQKEYRLYFSRMGAWMRQFDANVFLSETYRDAGFAREAGISDYVVIPNGADEREFGGDAVDDPRYKLGIDSESFLILTIGSHTGLKGHDESVRIFRRAKVRDATLVVIGNWPAGRTGGPAPTLRRNFRNLVRFGHPDRCPRSCALIRSSSGIISSAADGKSVRMMELSRVDTVALLRRADLFLFPSNLECSPIVLFEAMAAGVPFLASDVGNSREIVRRGRGGRILPTRRNRDNLSFADIRMSAKLVEELSREPRTRKELGRMGRDSWKRWFTWAHAADRYEQLYRRLVRR